MMINSKNISVRKKLYGKISYEEFYRFTFFSENLKEECLHGGSFLAKQGGATVRALWPSREVRAVCTEGWLVG